MLDPFEALMFLAFSVNWYWSIWRMLVTGKAAGNRAIFVALACIGYMAGISSKLLDWQTTGELSPLVYLFAWNVLMTAVDLALVLWLSHRPMQLRQGHQA